MEIARPAPPLSDGVIRLDPLSRAHLDDMEALAQDEDVLRHTYVEAPFGGNEAIEWVARYLEGWRTGTCAGFAVADPADGSFLGFCALVHVDDTGMEAEIGYITAPAARGRGIAARALVLISDWAIATLGLKRLELRIDASNLASQRVAERAGYEREGLLRSVHFKGGLRTDLTIYARTA